jgi:zinc transport system ATP-binding protein
MTSVPPVRLQDGAVALGGRPVLRGIDLSVAAGDFVALMGANGSGKSTLVKALTGLLPLTGGRLELFGTPIGAFRDWRRIGFVPQRAGAGSGVPASVWEVVASGRLTRRRLLRPMSRADRAAVDEAIEVVGLTDKARDGVSELSGGQQQRTLIARALAGRPDLLILDEPTAGVDAASQDAFAETLRRFATGGGTILLVAHELGPIEPLIDRAVVVHQGRIAYEGAVPEPAGHHAGPGHEHVHPHAAVDAPGLCEWSPADRMAG